MFVKFEQLVDIFDVDDINMWPRFYTLWLFQFLGKGLYCFSQNLANRI
ncbi:hypothetical protein GAPWKB11_1516 [Gilliamella apicola]|nr:hypothetical protein GAPWKB11_1516 [Gilliamella apicola]